ncbi:MAG: hypothetical protein JSS83_18915 [Cyanobacteria bacterium SZAS LIN-3]|nr:hypothetical protein [Cyanobacteria bacterium SZAS LIN-3]MBS2005979.1 hypothetical protein [Cyanobacteria bacterium SZAS TMP-1]
MCEKFGDQAHGSHPVDYTTAHNLLDYQPFHHRTNDSTQSLPSTSDLQKLSLQQLENLALKVLQALQDDLVKLEAIQSHPAGGPSRPEAPPPHDAPPPTVPEAPRPPEVPPPTRTPEVPTPPHIPDPPAPPPSHEHTSSGGGKFGPTPSWASATRIYNNNGGLVAPSFFAREIGPDVHYAAANLGNLKFETHGAQYDEGLMVDERGMKPQDLETVKVYEAVSKFESNESTGKYLGTIQVPKDMEYLRPITDYGNGVVVSTNSTLTFIQPDGKEVNFARGYLGPNAKVGNGQDVLIGTPVGHTGWFGNEGAITPDEAALALKDGTAPAHALDLYVPVDVLSKANKGVTGPAKYADTGYLSEYNSSNTNLKLGSLLAIPKNVTAEDLGLQTNMGKAVLASFEKYGAYIADTTHEKNALGLDTTVGVKDMIARSGQEKAFEQDINKIIAAAQIAL